MILDSIIISITYGDFNQFFQTSILPVDVQHSITARRRRRSVSVFARGVWGAEPPSKELIHLGFRCQEIAAYNFQTRI